MAYMGGNALPVGDPDAGLTGQLIGGKYRVSHLLGEGGMASVWAGSNEKTGKLVALKVIRPSVMAIPGAEAFLHGEGLVASRVNHPNVVTVFDVIEHEGMACIVMELLDGLPFGTYIAHNGPLSLHDTLALLLPSMRGVAAANLEGVIHRDLKPQNIFVCVGPDGRIITTKVLDFGISTMRDWARGSALAAMPGLVGTPAYMSPEHLENSSVVDARADVYGFGLLLYEALSGHMAFPAEPGPELLRRVLFETPVPLRELRPDLPLGAFAIVDTAMAKRPEQRFATLDQMISTIEDQLLSASALPLSGTPSAGVPISALSYTISSPVGIAVPAHVGREPSEPYCHTQIFGQPLVQREREPAAPTAEIAESPSRKLLALPLASQPAAPAPSAEAPAPAPFPSGPPTEVCRPGGARGILRTVRDFRILLPTALVIALGLPIIAWLATRNDPRATTEIRPAAAQVEPPAASPTAPAPAPVVEVIPSNDPEVAPLPAASLGLGQPAAEPAPAADDAQGNASADGSKGAGAPPAEKSRSAHGRSAKAKSIASAAKRPRAGALSVDDF